MWFEYFIWMSTCDARDSELKEVGRTEAETDVYIIYRFSSTLAMATTRAKMPKDCSL